VEKRPIGASRLPTLGRSTAETAIRHPPPDDGPRVLGRYRLARRLGTGAFGTVWLARDERLGRDVAVKIVARDRVSVGRFEREAKAAAQLAHPGIVTLYEAAIDDEGAYLVSELVRGATLGALLERGRLSDRDVVGIGIALCDALAHAHAHGVVHRDIKPSNVLVPEQPSTQAELAKLTDFGVARVIGDERLTLTGDVVGTAAYMAPEQAAGRIAGAPADLYSLALVLYEALTGFNPVATWTAAQRARRLGAHLPPVRRQRRDLPRELGQGIDLALRPRPRERGTVAELGRALTLAQIQVKDAPGVVANPWRRRTATTQLPDESRWRDRSLDDAPRQPARTVVDDRPTPAQPPTPIAWPARAIAAVATAVLVAWLVAHALAPSALAPAAAAVVAAVVVAALPRLGWAALTLVAAAALVAQGRPGGALIVLVAALVPVALLARSPSSWPLPAGAPALGVFGLAGCWPAIAARAASPWRRAALGFSGWIWLAIASSLTDANLYARRPATLPASVWVTSLPMTVEHVLVPVFSTQMLIAAAIWAGAAAVLPSLTERRSLPVAIVLVTIWSAMLVSAIATVLGVNHSRGAGMPATAVLGAVIGAIVALVPVAVESWRSSHRAVSLA
jgi:eukaryotic-like serine/threonine-protein kinase